MSSRSSKSRRTTRKRIGCVGIAVADVVGKPIEKFPGLGELMVFDQLAVVTGGCPVNTSSWLAKLGFPVSVVCNVGEDIFGRFVREELEKRGVDTRGVSVDKRSSTAFTFAAIARDGERRFFHTLGANGTFGIRHIRMDVIEECDMVVVGGTNLMKRFDGAETARFLKRAKRMGKTTALDMAFNDRIDDWMAVVGPSMPYLDYFLPSYEEGARASGKTDVADIAQTFLDMGAGVVAVKLAEKGAYVRSAREEIVAPSYRVKVADTVGAGDAWVAGFVAGLALELPLAEGAMLANAVAAQCVMGEGAAGGLKGLSAIKRFQRTNGQTPKVKRLN